MQWEYLTITLSLAGLDEELNKLGAKGWEMVNWAERRYSSNVRAIFKRPSQRRLEDRAIHIRARKTTIKPDEHPPGGARA